MTRATETYRHEDPILRQESMPKRWQDVVHGQEMQPHQRRSIRRNLAKTVRARPFSVAGPCPLHEWRLDSLIFQLDFADFNLGSHTLHSTNTGPGATLFHAVQYCTGTYNPIATLRDQVVHAKKRNIVYNRLLIQNLTLLAVVQLGGGG